MPPYYPAVVGRYLMDVNTMLVAIAAECTHPAVEVRYDPVERLYEATLRSPDVDPGRPVTRTGR
ncbi:MAG: hypothetical protein GWO24_10395, partial [Akkermansiaceae bacterium]|nr:hypothetical protein [Akkermansiaceae bacterium]